MRARWFETNDAPAWDELCGRACTGTFLHSRAYMAHHGERFTDRSVVFESTAGRLLGALPAALDPADASMVVSHPGLTYGGVLHAGELQGPAVLEALQGAARLWTDDGRRALVYKAVPHIYHRAPAQDDLYALFRLGATRTRCDLSASVNLQHRLPMSSRRSRSLRRARQAGLRLAQGAEHLLALWGVLGDNLARKHGAVPTHSAQEMAALLQRFPQAITLHTAWANDTIVAGVVLFHTPGVAHAQYIAASPHGHEMSALDLLFEQCIEQALARGARWFDFGISNVEQGRVLNEGLYRFKTEFGAGGVVHEFYRWTFGETADEAQH